MRWGDDHIWCRPEMFLNSVFDKKPGVFCDMEIFLLRRPEDFYFSFQGGRCAGGVLVRTAQECRYPWINLVQAFCKFNVGNLVVTWIYKYIYIYIFVLDAITSFLTFPNAGEVFPNICLTETTTHEQLRRSPCNLVQTLREMLVLRVDLIWFQWYL